MAWVEPLPSGRFRGCYRDARGKQRHVEGTFTQRAQALRAAGSKEDEQRKPGATDPKAGKITWGSWFEMWHASRTLAYSTKNEYRSTASNHILPTWKKVPLVDIDKLGTDTWVADLAANGASPWTIRVALQLFTASLNAAVENKKLGVNPAKGVKGLDLPKGLERYLTPDEVEAIAHYMQGVNQVIVWTDVSTGLRMGELAGLHVPRVDVDRGVIDVIEQFDQKAGVIKAVPKDKEERHVPIPPDVAAMLGDRIDTLPRTKTCGVKHETGRCPGGPLVLLGKRGAPLRSNEWGRGPWSRALKLAKIEGRVRPQDMRHTFASWLIQQGVSFAELARVMGHSDWEVTKKYAHLADEGYDAVRDAIQDKIASRGAARGATQRTATHHGASPDRAAEAL